MLFCLFVCLDYRYAYTFLYTQLQDATGNIINGEMRILRYKKCFNLEPWGLAEMLQTVYISVRTRSFGGYIASLPGWKCLYDSLVTSCPAL
jgi:hypothetical protein